jgi:hypothetical protein
MAHRFSILMAVVQAAKLLSGHNEKSVDDAEWREPGPMVKEVAIADEKEIQQEVIYYKIYKFQTRRRNHFRITQNQKKTLTKIKMAQKLFGDRQRLRNQCRQCGRIISLLWPHNSHSPY